MSRGVVEPALAALEETGEGEQQEAYRDALLGILAESGVRDDRILEVLVDALEDNPELGASNLSIYGDPRAVEPLSELLDRTAVDTSDTSLMNNHVIVEVSEAIFQLGGTLTPGQRQKVERVDELREQARHQPHPLFGASKDRQTESSEDGMYTKSEREEIGRNDPCWCGSGRKYKRCHLREEKN